MEKFITINGDRAWVSEKKSLEDARQSAINISDHNKEIIVRPIEQLTDHTRVYQNKPVDDILDDFEISEAMRIYGLGFTKSNNNGFVGGLFNLKGDSIVAIFDACFYVRGHEFPLNTKTLLLIKSLQYWNKTQ